jgi:hypothetical protein
MQHHAAEQLHVEVPHIDRPNRSLAHGGEDLHHDIVQRFAVFQAIAEFLRLHAELFVRHRLTCGSISLMRLTYGCSFLSLLVLVLPSNVSKNPIRKLLYRSFPWAIAMVKGIRPHCILIC